jgi:glycyl-tRNA synthetase
MLATLQDGYKVEEIGNVSREVMKIDPLLSPFFVCVIPLSKKFKEEALRIYSDLSLNPLFEVTYEESSSIGKSYRRQDAIGTYYCVTIDLSTVEEGTLTLRNRDDMLQRRISTLDIGDFLNKDYEEKFRKFVKN